MAANGADEARITLANGVELPPFRSIDEFLFNKHRFDIPPYNDLPKWNNRIIANLLFYQTNYFAFFAIMLVISTFFSAQDLVIGTSAIALVTAVVIFAISPNPQIYQMRRDHPLVTLGVIVLACYYFIAMLPSVFTVIFAVLFPLFVILCHASIRLRDFQNKIAQVSEKLGMRTTVMGRLLDICGISVRA